MKYQLVMLPQPILISDEPLSIGDICYNKMDKIHNCISPSDEKYMGSLKIIAGIPKLPIKIIKFYDQRN